MSLSNGAFTVYLPSNVDTVQYPNNTRSHFTVPLADPIELDGNWEVALQEAFIPNFWENVFIPFNEAIYVSCVRDKKNINLFLRKQIEATKRKRRRRRRAIPDDARLREADKLLHSPHDGDEAATMPTRNSVCLRIPPGLYTPSTFCVTFNNAIATSATGKRNRFKGLMSYNEITRKISISLHAGEKMRIKSARLRNMLGFEMNGDRTTSEIALRDLFLENYHSTFTRFITLPNSARFNANLAHMYMYTNIIEFSNVGDIYAPILKVINLDSCTPGKEVLHVYYNAPQYFTVKGNSLKDVEVQLKDSLDDFIHFEHGVVLLVFHFRKFVPRNVLSM
jgi:hypothetical protein